ncbi:MAG: CvpA family protein [Mangrovibacterium sp.]
MNYIDIVLGIILLIAAVRGFLKGFIVELASLVALVLGLWGAIHFSHYIGNFLSDTFNWNSKHAGLLAFVITFLLILVLIYILGKSLTQVAEAVQLGFLNKLAGMLFGILKTAVILSMLLVFFDNVDKNSQFLSPEIKEKSQVYEPIKNLVPTLLPFLDFRNLSNGTDDVKHEVEKTA